MPAEIPIAVPGTTSATAASAIASFSGSWSADLAANPGSNRALPGSDVAPPWTFSSRPAVVEQLEVAADGHVGHAEIPGEVADPDAAVLPDALEDQRLALASEHVRRVLRSSGRSRPIRSISRRSLSSFGLQRRLRHNDSQVNGVAHEYRSKALTLTPRRGTTIRAFLSLFVAREGSRATAGRSRRRRSWRTPRRRARRTSPPRATSLITRRRVLGGMAGVAGLAAAPSLLAACGPSRRRPRPPRCGRPASALAGARPPAAQPDRRGHARLELLRRRPEGGDAGGSRLVHGRDGHPGQDQHRRPRHVPGPDQLVPPGHAGRRLDLVLRASACGSSRSRAWRPTSATSGRRSSRMYGEAFKVGSTGNDGKQYFIPIYLYPWAVFYRKSLFDGEGLRRSRRRSTSSRPWPPRSRRDGLDPVRLRRQGRLARDGHVRHPQPPPQRLRLPRRADGRQGEVDRPEGQDGLRHVQGDPALPPGGRRRPDLAGRLGDAGPEEGRDVLPRDVHVAAVPGGRPGRPRRSRLLPVSGLRDRSSTPRRRSTPRSTGSPSARRRRTSTRPRRSSSTWPSRRPRSPG